jgi:3-oxoacyl-[acyl-carrier-protein] synthase-1
MGLETLWSRNAGLSLVALEQIKPSVSAALAKYGPRRVGVVLGSSTSGIDQGEEAVRHRIASGLLPSNYSYEQQQMGTVSRIIGRLSGAQGPNYTISTACSSSAKVFRSATSLIRMDLCDCVIVGGFDSLCKLTLNGFSALELVSDEITNPFSKNRKGISIGEGGALFVLERADKSQLGSHSVCLCGVGESSDAYHISSPDPEAKGAIAAIRRAISNAGLRADDIDYVNLHGTGTIHNDAMEARAMRSIFAETTPCSSTKPLVGHMLGASGATEVAFCWMALRDQDGRLPPHRFDGVLDPELPAMNFVSVGAMSQKPLRYALSNSFGFGGSNCAVILGRGDCVR